MKIVVLTQPLNINYGGLLQAFALQKVLRDMGHDVVTDRFAAKNFDGPFLGRLYQFIRHSFLLHCFGYKKYSPFRYLFRSRYKGEYLDIVLGRHTSKFIDKHIRTVDFFERRSAPSAEMLKKFDALCVGSDQVWRFRYNIIPSYFLDFAKDHDVRRVAYAASFGVDFLEKYKPNLIAQCRSLAQKFDAISVREDSGTGLCSEFFGVDALHVLDPTLLLEKEDYVQLIDNEDLTNASDRDSNRDAVLMTYILNESPEKQQVVARVADALSLSPIRVMPDELYTRRSKDIEKCIYPPVTEWLRGFRDARFVVTDSFHGLVFSLIFNVPFVVLSNERRGSARFRSLLKIFKLENRLISSLDELSPQLFEPIDFAQLNEIKRQWQDKSRAFLTSAFAPVR